MTINHRFQKRSLQKKPDNDDDDSDFGKTVVNELRPLPTILKIMFKRNINDMTFKYHIKKCR